MEPERLFELEADVWWALPWSADGEPWRAWRSSLGFVVLESPALSVQADNRTCLHALQMGLLAPWQLPTRLVLREQSLHLQTAWGQDDTLPVDNLAAALSTDLRAVKDLLAQWAQEETVPAPEEAFTAEPQALQIMSSVMNLIEQDPELSSLSELDDDSAELSIGGAEDDDWMILMRALPSGPQAMKVAVMLPQILLPTQELALKECLQQHLHKNDALQIGPQLQWVADAGGQQLFLQGLIDPHSCTLERLRVLMARMLAVDAEILEPGGASTAATPDALHIFLSGLRA